MKETNKEFKEEFMTKFGVWNNKWKFAEKMGRPENEDVVSTEEVADWCYIQIQKARKEVKQEILGKIPEERLERWTESCCPMVDKEAISFNACRSEVIRILNSLSTNKLD